MIGTKGTGRSLSGMRSTNINILFLVTSGIIGLASGSIVRGGEIGVVNITLAISLWSLSSLYSEAAVSTALAVFSAVCYSRCIPICATSSLSASLTSASAPVSIRFMTLS
jgi:hypothetical protein